MNSKPFYSLRIRLQYVLRVPGFIYEADKPDDPPLGWHHGNQGPVSWKVHISAQSLLNVSTLTRIRLRHSIAQHVCIKCVYDFRMYNAPVFALKSLKKLLFLLKCLITTPFVKIYNYIFMFVCKSQIYIIKKIIIMYMCTCIKVIAQKQTNQAM